MVAAGALALIAMLGQRNRALDLVVPPAPFVDLLNSIEWTVRNKSSFALAQLTESRDGSPLAELRARALASLIEMARWKNKGSAEIVSLPGRGGWGSG